MKHTQVKHGVHVKTTHRCLSEFRGVIHGWATDPKYAGRVVCENQGMRRYIEECTWDPNDLEVTA